MAAMRRGGSRIWGALLFSFWCGECVQMMALDAYTYWRTITVLVALMGLAMNRMERADVQLEPRPFRLLRHDAGTIS